MQCLCLYRHACCDPTCTEILCPCCTAHKLSVLCQHLQIGENRTHFKVGFAHVYGGPQSLERNARMAAQNNLSLGVIIALQTHSVNQIVATQAASDLRNYQWRMNGTSWAGREVWASTCSSFLLPFLAIQWKMQRVCRCIHAPMCSLKASRHSAFTKNDRWHLVRFLKQLVIWSADMHLGPFPWLVGIRKAPTMHDAAKHKRLDSHNLLASFMQPRQCCVCNRALKGISRWCHPLAMQ